MSSKLGLRRRPLSYEGCCRGVRRASRCNGEVTAVRPPVRHIAIGVGRVAQHGHAVAAVIEPRQHRRVCGIGGALGFELGSALTRGLAKEGGSLKTSSSGRSASAATSAPSIDKTEKQTLSKQRNAQVVCISSCPVSKNAESRFQQ